MSAEPLIPPTTDPTSIFEFFRGSYGTELLTAAVVEFDLFRQLVEQPKSFDELRSEIGLQRRPAVVLFTALRAMGLLTRDSQARFSLTPLSREHLVSGAEFDVSGYIALAGGSPGVREMIERLKTNRPAGASDSDEGTAFIYREGTESAMEAEASARFLTLSLAGRAKNVAPVLAERVSLEGARTVLDVGGGSGIYSIAWLRRHPTLRAIVWDRPEVLKVAREMAEQYGVADRLDCVPGDMFVDPVPAADVVLLSNILHDWDEPDCRTLIERCSAALPLGGRLLIHDVLLNDDHSGPLPIALYSAALFTLTEGRAYSAGEFQAWLVAAGLSLLPIVPTLVHCAVVGGQR
ncbi:MAG: methyltransferase [Planctomycetaceae bacterium]